MLTGKVGPLRTIVMRLQNGNNLYFGKSLLLHIGTSLGQNYREIPHSTWAGLRVKGQFYGRL
jgi:hypothetical protein